MTPREPRSWGGGVDPLQHLNDASLRRSTRRRRPPPSSSLPPTPEEDGRGRVATRSTRRVSSPILHDSPVRSAVHTDGIVKEGDASDEDSGDEEEEDMVADPSCQVNPYADVAHTNFAYAIQEDGTAVSKDGTTRQLVVFTLLILVFAFVVWFVAMVAFGQVTFSSSSPYIYVRM